MAYGEGLSRVPATSCSSCSGQAGLPYLTGLQGPDSWVHHPLQIRALHSGSCVAERAVGPSVPAFTGQSGLHTAGNRLQPLHGFLNHHQPFEGILHLSLSFSTDLVGNSSSPTISAEISKEDTQVLFTSWSVLSSFEDLFLVCIFSAVLFFIFPKWFISIFPDVEGYH